MGTCPAGHITGHMADTVELANGCFILRGTLLLIISYRANRALEKETKLKGLKNRVKEPINAIPWTTMGFYVPCWLKREKINGHFERENERAFTANQQGTCMCPDYPKMANIQNQQKRRAK
jgi:hypothetical protein